MGFIYKELMTGADGDTLASPHVPEVGNVTAPAFNIDNYSFVNEVANPGLASMRIRGTGYGQFYRSAGDLLHVNNVLGLKMPDPSGVEYSVKQTVRMDPGAATYYQAIYALLVARASASSAQWANGLDMIGAEFDIGVSSIWIGFWTIHGTSSNVVDLSFTPPDPSWLDGEQDYALELKVDATHAYVYINSILVHTEPITNPAYSLPGQAWIINHFEGDGSPGYHPAKIVSMSLAPPTPPPVIAANMARYGNETIGGKAHVAPYNGNQVVAQFVMPLSYGVTADHSASYSSTIPVKRAHTMSYRIWDTIPVVAANVAPYTARVAAALAAVYADTPVVKVAWSAPYTDSLKVKAAWTGLYGNKPRVTAANLAAYDGTAKPVKTQHIASYAYWVAVKAAHVTSYSEPVRVAQAMTALYGPSVKVSAGNTFAYSLRPQVAVAMDMPYAGTSTVQVAMEAKWDLSLHNFVKQANKAFWSILSNSVINVQSSATLQRADSNWNPAGEVLHISDGVVTQSEDSVAWEARVRLADIKDFVLLNDLDPVIFSIGDHVYNLIITSKSLSRDSPVGIDCQIAAKSAVVLFDAPFMPAISYSNEVPITAQEVVEGFLGTTVEWLMPNWSLPAHRIAFEGVTPMAAVRTLLGAAGGVLLAYPDGSLRVQSKYPVPVPMFDTVEPDHVFTDAEDNLSVSEEHEIREGYSRFRISEGSTSFGDKMEYIPDQLPTGQRDDKGKPITEASPTSGTLRAYPSPYRTSFTVVPTNNPTITPLSMVQKGEVVHDETQELIVFSKGIAGLSYPIYGIVRLDWHSQALGSVSFEPGSTSLTASGAVNGGYGMATVVYNTKSFEYKIKGVGGTSVLFLMEDNGE